MTKFRKRKHPQIEKSFLVCIFLSHYLYRSGQATVHFFAIIWTLEKRVWLYIEVLLFQPANTSSCRKGDRMAIVEPLSKWCILRIGLVLFYFCRKWGCLKNSFLTKFVEKCALFLTVSSFSRSICLKTYLMRHKTNWFSCFRLLRKTGYSRDVRTFL